MTQFLKDTRKVVGCDLDDVLADFIAAFMDIAAQKYGVDPDIFGSCEKNSRSAAQ